MNVDPSTPHPASPAHPSPGLSSGSSSHPGPGLSPAWQCMVCSAQREDLVVLPMCAHKFCDYCLHNWYTVYISKYRGHSGSFPCQICWTLYTVPMEGSSAFKQNYHMNLLQQQLTGLQVAPPTDVSPHQGELHAGAKVMEPSAMDDAGSAHMEGGAPWGVATQVVGVSQMIGRGEVELLGVSHALEMEETCEAPYQAQHQVSAQSRPNSICLRNYSEDSLAWPCGHMY